MDLLIKIWFSILLFNLLLMFLSIIPVLKGKEIKGIIMIFVFFIQIALTLVIYGLNIIWNWF